MVQQQVQKLQIQQTIQTLQQTYLSNPALFRDYSQFVEQLNAQIAAEAQKLELYQSLYQSSIAQQFARQIANAQQVSTPSSVSGNNPSVFNSNLFNNPDLFAPHLAQSSLQSQNQSGSRQLRIDQLFSAAPNRSTLSGTSQLNLTQPKEEPGPL